MKEENEKVETGGIVVQNKFLKWLDNLWYHYKWHIIIVTFFVAVFGICMFQCAGNERPDVVVTYAGSYTLNASEAEEINKLFNSLVREDEEENELNTKLNHFGICSEEELKAKHTDPDDPDKGISEVYPYAKQVNANNINSFTQFMMTGESAVWLVSEHVYNAYVNRDRLVPLSDMGIDLTHAMDGYAIRFADTDFYKDHEILHKLPEDTLLVFAQGTLTGATSDKETYQIHKQLFRAIVGYSAAK